MRLTHPLISGRNQEYLDLSISYTVAVFGRAQIIAMFPSFLKPCVIPLLFKYPHVLLLTKCAHNRIFGRLLSSRRSSIRQAMKTLGPVIEKRLAQDAELGPGWVDRPVRCRS